MIGLRIGDRGERVKALQELLRVAGHDPGETDGDYGPRTAAAVLACRRSVGSTAKDGNTISGHAYEQIHRAHAIKVAGKVAGKPGTVDDAQVAAAIVRIAQRSADAQG